MVQRDVIYLCVVLQELLDAVHVVPLCCHVDWREAILQERNICYVGKQSAQKKEEQVAVFGGGITEQIKLTDLDQLSLCFITHSNRD